MHNKEFIEVLIVLLQNHPEFENQSVGLKEFVKQKGNYTSEQIKKLLPLIVHRSHWVAILQMIYLIPT